MFEGIGAAFQLRQQNCISLLDPLLMTGQLFTKMNASVSCSRRGS